MGSDCSVCQRQLHCVPTRVRRQVLIAFLRYLSLTVHNGEDVLPPSAVVFSGPNAHPRIHSFSYSVAGSEPKQSR